MIPKIGNKFLISTDDWFTAPDGEQYKSVYGTIVGVYNDEQALGIKTNRGSTNWYLGIGNMIIAGCQIHYAIRTDSINRNPCNREIEYKGKLNIAKNEKSRIYNADS